MVLMKVVFIVYDAIVYTPFKILADPEDKLARSKCEKARPIVEGDPSAPWRHVDTIDKPLYSRIFPDCHTLGAVWDRAAQLHEDSLCLGSRDVVQVFEEAQSDGRTFQKLILGEYQWLDYTKVDKQIAQIGLGLIALNIKQGDKVVIYAETRKEWLMTAIACFKRGIPVVTVYATLGEEAVAFAMKECDAVAVVTTRSLLTKVKSAIEDVGTISKVIYFYDLYQNPDEVKTAPDSLVEEFKALGRELYSFEELLELENDLWTDVEVKADDLALIIYTSADIRRFL
uniref:long-chain-fatty-acid--CoA ligase n=1 Tax=Panagrellus redivivus TaxID=6233 RepID=A0A7E4VH34_PANRE